jgi:hypothetical protein
MLQYPIFITDDPDAEVLIPSLPGQKRCARPSPPDLLLLISFFLSDGVSTASKAFSLRS